MLAENLKDYTRSVHSELEQRLLSHIQAVRNVQHYGSLLALMYGYYAALERQLEKFASSLPDYDHRRKADSILEDLKTLNFSTESLCVCEDLPAIRSVASALGAMYVLEGSTLGGKIISKLLRKQVPAVSESIRFFEGYRERTGEMWQRFKTHLSDSVERPHFAETQEAAHETFLKFKNWIDKHEPAKL
jgi:heme oxygenase (biliverdin-IX-beta and delta-forming)